MVEMILLLARTVGGDATPQVSRSRTPISNQATVSRSPQAAPLRGPGKKPSTSSIPPGTLRPPPPRIIILSGVKQQPARLEILSCGNAVHEASPRLALV